VTDPAPAKRPVSIFLTVACAFAGAVDLQLAARAYSPEFRQALAGHPWANTAVLALALFQVGSLVLLWRGRKAGLFGFLALAAAYNVLMAAIGAWAARYLLIPALVAAAGAWTWDRLR
jgi:hypothetical protein